jgi:hypothetical protein
MKEKRMSNIGLDEALSYKESNLLKDIENVVSFGDPQIVEIRICDTSTTRYRGFTIEIMGKFQS